MKLFCLLFSALLIGSCTQHGEKTSSEKISSNQEETIYYFIRHAEKDRSNPSNPDPALTEEGHQRAQRWALFFKDKSIDEVYATDYLRTMATAQPTATSINKEIQPYDPTALNSSSFQENTKGKTILVVGHSNTTPNFVNKILGETRYQEINDTVFSTLYKVVKQKDSTIASVQTID